MNANSATKMIRFRPFLFSAVAIFFAALAFPAIAQVPPAHPGAPVIGTAIAGNGQVTVAFTPPSSNGGSPITQYVVSCNVAGATRGVATGTASPLTVTGLANGTAVTCRVGARNAAGFGPVSADSNAVTPTAPAAAPVVPTNAVATAGNGQISVAFSAPSNPAGYVAICQPQNGDLSLTRTGRGPASPVTVTGLTNGTAYTCTVAVASGGTRSAQSNVVTPTAPAAAGGAPVVPTNAVATAAGTGQISVAFNAPSNPAGYVAICQPQNGDLSKTRTGRGAASPVVVPGLTSGIAYTCTVALASGGTRSAQSNSVTPK